MEQEQAEKRDALSESLKELAFEYEALEGVKLKSQEYLKSLDLTVTDKNKEIERLNKQIIEANSLEDKITDLKKIITTLNNNKLLLENDITSLDNEQKALSEQVDILRKEVDSILEDNKLEITQHIDKITELQAKEGQLDLLIYDKRIQYSQFDADMEKVRMNLVSREQQLDDRDSNLRVRELKVEQQEGKIRQNANLLNL